MQIQRIDVQLNAEEARELRGHAFLAAPYFRFWLRHPLASFVFVGVSFFGGKWAVQRFLRVPFVDALVPLGLVAVALVVLLWWVLARRNPHHRCAAYSLDLGPEGVRSTCRHGEHFTPWTEIESIAETPQLMLLQLARGSVIGIPKRCIVPGATLQDVVDAIRRLRSQVASPR